MHNDKTNLIMEEFLMRETSFLLTKREKVCLAILEKLIEVNIPQDPGDLLPNIHCAELVSKAVNMTDQMLVELKVKGQHLPKGAR